MNMRIKRFIFAIMLAMAVSLVFFLVRGDDTFKIEKALLPTAWEYRGVITEQSQAAKIRENIEGFKSRSGVNAEEKYGLALTVAQEYMKIGAGKEAYDYLLRASRIDPVNSVTYQSMGNLFTSLSAEEAALLSFKKAIDSQPQIVQNYFALIDFYKKQNSGSEVIDTAFNDSLTATNRNLNILKEYAGWLEGEKKLSDALVVWQEVLERDPNPAVQQKVSQLKAKIR